MNRVFSKGVKLLIQNWDLLDEIQRAKEELGRTVSEAVSRHYPSEASWK